MSASDATWASKDIDRLARWTVVAICLLFAVLLFSRQALNSFGMLVTSDGTGYFSHLPSLLLDRDIDYSDEFRALEREGERNQWSVGTAVMWLPFFLAGHLFTRAAVGLGWALPLDGTALPEQLACCLGSIVYGGAATYLAYRLACRWFEPWPSLVGSGLLFLGGNLPYYMLVEPYMSHAVSAFLSTLFLTLFLTSAPLSPRSGVFIGVLAGLMALTRPADGLWVVLPFFWAYLGGQPMKTLFAPLLLAGVVSLTLYLPQLIIWEYGMAQSGIENQMVVRTISDRLGPLSTLFGWQGGLFLWHPVYLLCVWGVLRLRAHQPPLAKTLLLGLLIQLILVEVWGGQGQAFGGRMYLICFPAFVLGATEIAGYLGTRRVAVTAAVLGSLNLLLILLYRARVLPW